MIRIMTLLLGWLILTSSLLAEEGIRARVTLNSRQQWDVELIGRFRTDRVLLRRSDEPAAIELMVADIRRIDFPLSSRAATLVDQFDAGQFAEAAPRLEATVQPYLLYVMDASSNLDVLLRALVKSWYWAGDDTKALESCNTILSATTTGALFTEATAIRVLSLLRQGRIDEAGEAGETLTAPAAHEPEVAAYWYAKASLQLSKEDLAGAQESLARLICFRSRDPEWMPPALLLSAQGYAQSGQTDVAREVLDEVQLNYPGTPWAARAAATDVNPVPADAPSPH